MSGYMYVVSKQDDDNPLVTTPVFVTAEIFQMDAVRLYMDWLWGGRKWETDKMEYTYEGKNTYRVESDGKHRGTFVVTSVHYNTKGA